ncbi:MAG: DUF4384 domain-containing protein, partial [Deltaproteobacteria bacterium]|nr:DUF4384 domain-containing protein [Deltaproteobacteria bacterium]
PSSPTQSASGPFSSKLSGSKKPIFAGMLVVAAMLLLGIVVLRETGRELQEPHGIPAVQPDGRTTESAYNYTADRQTDLSLRPLHTRRQELKSKFSRQQGAVDERLLRKLLRIKTGVTGSSHVSPGIRQAVNMVLDVSDLVSRVETGDCDVLLTLAEQDSTLIIKIDDTVYENASNGSSRIILPTIDTDRLKTQLTAMINRAYCFMLLRSFSLLNTVDNPHPIQLEVSGGTNGMFRVGEDLEICLTPARGSACMLFNLNLNGLYMLFPRFGHVNNYLEAQKGYCSGSIEVAPPVGTELVFAVSVTNPKLLSNYRYDFSQSRQFMTWSYGRSEIESTVTFCERLLVLLLNSPGSAWTAESSFITTH